MDSTNEASDRGSTSEAKKSVFLPVVFTALIMALQMYLRNFIVSLSNDQICFNQNSTVLMCTDSWVSDELEENGLLDFTVKFKNPYNDDVIVAKYPVQKEETIRLRGAEVIWKGTHDLAKMKILQKTIVTFRHKTNLDPECHHFYKIQCPHLDLSLTEKTKKWQEIEQPFCDKTCIMLGMARVHFFLFFLLPFTMGLVMVASFNVVNE